VDKRTRSAVRALEIKRLRPFSQSTRSSLPLDALTATSGSRTFNSFLDKFYSVELNIKIPLLYPKFIRELPVKINQELTETLIPNSIDRGEISYPLPL
jgi:hypothetical protein